MGRKKQAAPCRRTHPSTTVGAAAISTSPSEFVSRSDGCAVWAAISSSSAGPANTSSPRPVATVTPPKHQNISPGSSKGAIIKRRLRRVPRRVLGSSSPSQSDVEDDIVLEQNNGMTPNRYSGSRMIHDAESDAQVDNQAARSNLFAGRRQRYYMWILGQQLRIRSLSPQKFCGVIYQKQNWWDATMENQ